MINTTVPTQNAVSAARPAWATGWVVAAIAVQLLVTSMASAATTCSETIERTRVTRLSHCVAQAIRELVDQGVEPTRMIFERESEPVFVEGLLDSGCTEIAWTLSPWLLNLPPPLIG